MYSYIGIHCINNIEFSRCKLSLSQLKVLTSDFDSGLNNSETISCHWDLNQGSNLGTLTLELRRSTKFF